MYGDATGSNSPCFNEAATMQSRKGQPPVKSPQTASSFNEAATMQSRKAFFALTARLTGCASMRPRPCSRGKELPGHPDGRLIICFNEAATMQSRKAEKRAFNRSRADQLQ